MDQQTKVRVIGGLIGAAVMAVALAVTMEGAAAQGPGPGGGPGFRRGGPGGPAELGVTLPSLTDAQRQQIRSIVQSHREENRALIARERAARQALQASAESGQVDQNQASELGAATAALAAARAQTHAEVLQVLTPEQRQELKAKRDAMKAWLDARPGGRGGRGNRPAPAQ